MRNFWFSPKTIGFILPLLVGVALEVGGWVSHAIAYALFAVAFVWAVCALIYWWRNKKGRQPETTAKDYEYNHSAHITKIVTDAKSEPLLVLPDALQALGELDIELTNDLGRIKRTKTKLTSIQSQLKKDWGIKPPKTSKKSSEQTIRDVVNQTVKKKGISYTSVNEETMMFMLHIAGVLDDEKVGISAQRENDDRYKAVIKLQAKVATQELNNAIKVYLWYSLGINSILLFISYFPTEAVKSILQIFGKTSTELRAEREQTLRFLLTNISKLIEKELHREK